jgi:hypothetical protein
MPALMPPDALPDDFIESDDLVLSADFILSDDFIVSDEPLVVPLPEPAAPLVEPVADPLVDPPAVLLEDLSVVELPEPLCPCASAGLVANARATASANAPVNVFIARLLCCGC